MKKCIFAISAIAAFALASSANAADMPTKAPIAPSPVYLGGFFGEITGAYDFRDPIKDWQEFGPGSGTISTKAGLWSGLDRQNSGGLPLGRVGCSCGRAVR